MTIGEFAEMHLDLAKTNIISNGGELFERAGENYYRIKTEKPSVVEEIPVPLHRHEELLTEFKPAVLEGLKGDSISQAAAVYLAVCLGIASEVEQDMIEEWEKAISSFMPYYKQLFEHGMWSQEARDYFKAVIINRESTAEYPLIPKVI